jgi:hypothetical protein
MRSMRYPPPDATLFDTLVGVRPERLLERILRGDIANVDFSDLVRLVEALGFREIGGKGSPPGVRSHRYC